MRARVLSKICIVFRGGARPAIGRQAAHQRRGAAAVPLLLVLQLERVPATVTGNG
jgi:hypothetical protein